ncbi:hypothetical protein [Endozoicomonas sp.]|uniref:hypothetical protein n=1 Tax=Endozoicomonas sp. TaxID=1892382 RepID=UPI003AF818EB
MSTLNLSKSTLEQLLAARRLIRAEFNEILHLSDERLVEQLLHYRDISDNPETQAILSQCFVSLQLNQTPETTNKELHQSAPDLSELLEKAEAAKKQKNEYKWSQMGSAVFYFD